MSWQHYVLLLLAICVKFTRGIEQIDSDHFDADQDYRGYNEERTIKNLSNLSDNDSAIHFGKIQGVPWWNTFINNIINYFYRQQDDNRSQFGVLFMADINHLDNFQYDFQPHTQAGMPLIDNTTAISPSSSIDFINFVSSRPENVTDTMIPAENRILNEMKNLWNAYCNRFGKTPNFMILYSWIMPCPDCTNLIINHFNQKSYRNVKNRIVAYTVEGTNCGLRYMTPEGNEQSRNNLRNENITVYRQSCNGLDATWILNDDKDQEQISAGLEDKDVLEMATYMTKDDLATHVCQVHDTFQGCMVSCLADICYACKDDQKKAVAVSFVNELTQFCATSDLETCPANWMNVSFAGNQNYASDYTDFDAMSRKVQNCAAVSCFGLPLSKPLDPNNPYHFPGYLTNFSDISELPQVDLTDLYEDVRAEQNNFTAGNTLCRSDNQCGFHGYSYSWCYVDYYDNWDYCCTGPCGFNQDENYMWCESGSTWQYCGDAGSVTIGNQPCLIEFPCGMHQEDGKASYYWCYTDTSYWNYCCQPSDTCSQKGSSYNWCYVGYQRHTTSKTCTPPD